MYAMTMFSCKGLRLVVAGVIFALVLSGTARAQDDPNTGALTFTGGLDVLPGSTYVFRGIVQEAEPKLTLWPYGDIGFALGSGEGGVKNVSLNFGVWNSLHTGSSGSTVEGQGSHYEEDFYTTLTLGLGSGFTFGTTYTAYTSPNGLFDTVNELSFKVSKAHRLAPYGILAFEIGDGSRDGGESGTYLELGVGPSLALGRSTATLVVPVRLGLSISDYYEHPVTGEDGKFGFFDVGALVTLPLGGVPRNFGSWNLHFGFDILLLGDTTEYFNKSNNVKITGLFGIGLSY